MPENPKVIVERCGVVNINNGSSAHIRVNSDDLITEIYHKIFDEINPNDLFYQSVVLLYTKPEKNTSPEQTFMPEIKFCHTPSAPFRALFPACHREEKYSMKKM